MWKLPPEARRVLGRMWTRPQFFEALGSQIEHVSQSAAEMLRDTHENLIDMPLIVMSSSAAHGRRIAADLALAKQSRRGRHIVAPESGHWVPLDAPQAVIDAIVDIVDQVRA